MTELNKAEKYLLENLTRLANEGYVDENPRPKYKSDGTPAHTISINHVVMTYDLSKGEFPFSEARPQAWKTGIQEIRAFYQGQTSNLDVLENEYGLSWWRDWEVGDTNTHGIRYGETVKRYNIIDNLIKGLKEDKFSRRHIINLWQEQDFIDDKEGLKPCALMSMYSVRKVGDDYYLDATLIQRSSNFLIAGFINQSQYVALQMMLAKSCGYKIGVFTHFINNFHVYDREVEQAEEITKRIHQLKQRENQSKPILKLNVEEGTSFYDITVDDFELINYDPIKPQLKFDLAI